MADVVRWHLAPFRCQRRPFVSAFYTDMYVDEDDTDLDPAPYSLVISGDLRIRDTSLARVLAQTVYDVQSLVPRLARDYLCLHAGAVAREGESVVIAAATEYGKSSLVTALLERGFDYLSDEVAPFDPVTGRVHPFPRHIKLDRAALERFPDLAAGEHDRMYRLDTIDRFIRPEDIGASIAGPSRLRCVVFPTTDFEGPPRLRAVTKAEAVHRMVSASFNLHRYQERGTIVLARAVENAQTFVVEGGSPAERAAVIDDALG